MKNLKQQNLLIITTDFPDKDNRYYGGIFVKDQIEYLKKYFNKITVIAQVPRTFGIFDSDKVCKDYNYSNVDVYFPRFWHLPTDFFRKHQDMLRFKAVNKILIKNNIDFDIIHAHFTFPSGEIGSKLKELYDKPLVITAHGEYTYSKPFENKYWKDKITKIFNNSDYIIGVSEFMASKIKKLGISKNVKVINNGYNDKIYKPINQNLCRQKLKISEHKKIILSVGTVRKIKGHEFLIRAIKNVSQKRDDIICFIVGDDSSKYATSMKALVSELKLEDKVIFVGKKTQKEISLWMNACDLFVLPSIKESFGIVQIEALACGKPIVATQNGGSEEIIKKSDYGYIVPVKNQEQLADKINLALDKKWNKNKIFEYSNKYRWPNIIKDIINVYENV